MIIIDEDWRTVVELPFEGVGCVGRERAQKVAQQAHVELPSDLATVPAQRCAWPGLHFPEIPAKWFAKAAAVTMAQDRTRVASINALGRQARLGVATTLQRLFQSSGT